MNPSIAPSSAGIRRSQISTPLSSGSAIAANLSTVTSQLAVKVSTKTLLLKISIIPNLGCKGEFISNFCEKKAGMTKFIKKIKQEYSVDQINISETG
jgi:hypothetical protein